MTDSFNIIGDIAGNFKTLMALLSKMPSGIPISCGDMVDRGPRSREVLDFFMHHGKAVMGNHEHMMINYFTKTLQGLEGFYEGDIWQFNGGTATLKSFSDENGEVLVDTDIIDWLQGLPFFIKVDGAVITHAPIRGDFTLEQCLQIGPGFNRRTYGDYVKENPDRKSIPRSDDSVLWYRGTPRRKDDLGLQIHGHQSYKGVQWFNDNKASPFAVCLDTCRAQILTGMHWPSQTIYQQEYID